MRSPLLLALWAVCCSTATAAETRPGRPNVVIFLADDAGWGDYSHSGNTQVSTPRIDSLAREGVTFDRFFVQPVCSPTRAEFLTGRYHPRGGVKGVSTGQERLNLDESTLVEAFQKAGYATGAFGKWHNGSQWPYHPMARGFGEFFGYTSGHWGEYFDAPLEDNGRMVRTKGYIVDVCTDRALAFIERNKARPFLCYVPFTTPHSPWGVPEKDWAHFQNRKPLPASVPARENPEETRCALAMMENQDANVGRVLDRLRTLGLEDNTIVLYFSDNGPNTMRWTGGMKGMKATTDEGGVRSICHMRWPHHLQSGGVILPIAGAIDLLPTLTSLAGITRVGDKPLDGRDLSPLLLGQDAAWPERLLFSCWGGKVSVRSQTHRLDHEGNLYDLRTDPGQKSAINDREPALAARLKAAAEAWRKEMFGAEGGRDKDNARVDQRPIPVGYREFPVTMLPARDGEPHGQVTRSASAPNSSYFVNWTDLGDRMEWLLQVHTAGVYEVTADYTCRAGDEGAKVELSFGESRLTTVVAPAWDPPLYTNQDTIPRPRGESRMKDFHTLSLGRITLPQTQGLLTLRALEIPGRGVMDLRRLTLTLLD